MILRSHREWLAIVAGLPESDLPCNVSTVAYAIEVASAAVEAHDGLQVVVDQLVASICDDALAEGERGALVASRSTPSEPSREGDGKASLCRALTADQPDPAHVTNGPDSACTEKP